MTTLQTILVTVLIAIWLIFSVVFLITAIQSWIYDRKREKRDREQAIRDALDSGRIAVIVARRPCILAAPKIRQYERNALQVKTVCANACTAE